MGTLGTQEEQHWGWLCSPLGCQAEPQNSPGPTPSPHPNVPGPGPWNEEEPFQPVLPKYCGGLLEPLQGDSTRVACAQTPTGAVPSLGCCRKQAGVANAI